MGVKETALPCSNHELGPAISRQDLDSSDDRPRQLSIRVTPEVQAVNNGTDRAGGTLQSCKVRGKDKSCRTRCRKRVFCLCLCPTLLTRQAFVCRSHLQLPGSSPLPISSQTRPPLVHTCTNCTTLNPTRQPAGHVKSRSFPSVAIDVILWNALHVPTTLAARLLGLVGACPSASYRLAHDLARLLEHRPDTLNYALPMNNSLTVYSALLA